MFKERLAMKLMERYVGPYKIEEVVLKNAVKLKLLSLMRIYLVVKVGLERLDMQEGITVKALLDSGAMGLVMSSEFARKQGFKLKKLERPMQVRNMNRSFNKEGPIENTMKVNIYYKRYMERMEIDIIEGQK